MFVMKNLNRAALVVSLALGAVCAASAEQFEFTYSGDGVNDLNSAYGSLTATNNMDGTFLATAGTMVVTASSNPVMLGSFSLSSSSDFFNINNLLYYPGTQSLDNLGLLFKNNVGAAVNIWGNGAPDNYSFYGNDGSGYNPSNDYHGTFTLKAVPEPFTVSLAVAGLGLAARRRRSVKV